MYVYIYIYMCVCTCIYAKVRLDCTFRFLFTGQDVRPTRREGEMYPRCILDLPMKPEQFGTRD